MAVKLMEDNPLPRLKNCWISDDQFNLFKSNNCNFMNARTARPSLKLNTVFLNRSIGKDGVASCHSFLWSPICYGSSCHSAAKRRSSSLAGSWLCPLVDQLFSWIWVFTNQHLNINLGCLDYSEPYCQCWAASEVFRGFEFGDFHSWAIHFKTHWAPHWAKVNLKRILYLWSAVQPSCISCSGTSAPSCSGTAVDPFLKEVARHCWG